MGRPPARTRASAFGETVEGVVADHGIDGARQKLYSTAQPQQGTARNSAIKKTGRCSQYNAAGNGGLAATAQRATSRDRTFGRTVGAVIVVGPGIIVLYSNSTQQQQSKANQSKQSHDTTINWGGGIPTRKFHWLGEGRVDFILSIHREIVPLPQINEYAEHQPAATNALK